MKITHRMKQVGNVLAQTWRRISGVVIPLLVLVAFAIGYSFAADDDAPTDPTIAQNPTAPETNSEQQWYTCSMHPEVRMPNPDDKCPICHMDLIPVGGGQGQSPLGSREIKLSPEAMALVDVQTTPVVRRFIEFPVRMVGEVAYDETRLAYITAYMSGRLDRLFVDYVGMEVRKGDHLAEIYSPNLQVAQQELLEARRALDRLGPNTDATTRNTAKTILQAARERLRLLGLNAQQIESAETSGVADDHVTLYAPTSGIVIDKNAKQGSYVKEGDRIYTIGDLSHVWVVLRAYESDLPWLRYGQKVKFTAQPFGDETFEGTISFISPTLDPKTRTVEVRVNAPNPDGRLRPGMFVNATVQAQIAAGGRVITPDLSGKWISPMHPEVVRNQPGDCPVCGMPLVKAEDLGYTPASSANADPPLVVPDTAVLRTGRRGVVYVRMDDEQPDAVFQGREVELGPRGKGFFIIRAGLHEGERVATNGNFQIDSELQIQAKPSMMNPEKKTAEANPAQHEYHTMQQGEKTRKEHLHGDKAKAAKALIETYLSLSTALANDDVKASRQAVEHIEKTAVSVNLLNQKTAVQDAIKKLKQADDLAQWRSAFKSLSDALIAWVKQVHIENAAPLYRAFCPMAFDFAGASWLTDKKEILNPYFGEKMLHCGTIEETLVKAGKPKDE